jgi:trimeric autotransporter adhesin
VIELTSELPPITGVTHVNGAGSGGARVIIRPAAIAPDSASNGITVGTTSAEGAAGSSIRNLVLNGFTACCDAGEQQTGQAIRILDANVSVKSNLFGTDATGTTAASNRVGIVVEAPNALIGGTSGTSLNGPCSGDCNLISGSGEHGIQVMGGSALIQGNFIGTNLAGTTALGNQEGVRADSPSTIGGDVPEAGNLISGNIAAGIYARTGGMLTRNNIIAFNGIGVVIDGVLGDASGNTVQGNSIHSHAGMGIDLVNGANGYIQPPVINTATLSSAAGTACVGCAVDIYSDDVDEGRVYLGPAITVNGL